MVDIYKEDVKKCQAKKMTVSDISKQLKISRSSVQRCVTSLYAENANKKIR